jgi:transposase
MTSTIEELKQEDKILKRDRLGRVRVERPRREALLDEFERSGSSGVEFAKLVGVKYPTFANWIQSRREEREEANQSGTKAMQSGSGMWVEAVLEKNQTKRESKAESLVVELSALGARMNISTTAEAMLAARLLGHLKELDPTGLRHA